MDKAESSMKLSYELLKEITHDFSKKLGCGTYGVVYKGTNANGKDVAVKVLRDMAALDDKEFTNEFQNLVKLDHQNIVQLVGYCNESKPVIVEHNGRQITADKLHLALCFEYVNNGNLGDHITDENQGLHWHIRYKIVKGICEGLNCLHEGRIMHLDLKPGNILLDKDMVPKIADFGLSRLIGDERTKQTMNKSIGTHGYLPPEYTKFQLLSTAFDIYSLGIIITKIMVGRERYHDIADMPPRKLVKHVHTTWRKKLQEIVGARSLLEVYCQQVKTCIDVASKCLTEDRHQRPTIQKIVTKLKETETMYNIVPSKIQEYHNVQSVPASTRSIMSISASEKDGQASRSNWPSMTLKELSYKLLKSMTDDFSNERKLGRGAYGEVYKGVFEDGQVIAIRKLQHNLVNLNGKESRKELTTLATLQHENIIQLVGYCDEEEPVIVEHQGRNITAIQLHRALCFEYMPNGNLGQYISDDVSVGLEWCTRYKIIRGICGGLRYLHQELARPILNLDLNPNNILLDENMVPKLSDFGLSRFIGESSIMKTLTHVGTTGYLPPEFLNYQVISTKFDIFSLGVIILWVVAGRSSFSSNRNMMKFQQSIEQVHGKWRTSLQKKFKGRSLKGYCRQVKKCYEIAWQCMEVDRHKRPNIGDIIRILDETETIIHEASTLLDVQPMELRFPLMLRKRHASSLLCLRNKEEDSVAFRLVSKTQNQKMYHMDLPLHGTVPPRCSYTLALTTSKQPQHLPSDSDDNGFVLQSVAVSSSQELQLQYLGRASVIAAYESIFKEAQESADDEVQEETIKCVCAPAPSAEEASSSSKLARPEIEIIATLNAQKASSIEVHPTEPWIMTTHEAGNLRVWNYNTMELFKSFDDEPVYVAKFIAREEWIVAGDGNGCIHVYSYDEYQDTTSFQAHKGRIMSLAVHPTDSYVLSSSHDDSLIKLWHWDRYWDFDKGPWARTRTFEGHTDKVSRLVFNREDPGYFASASWDGTVKIWGLNNNSNVCNTMTSDMHQDGLLCVDFIIGADRQHLITGSKDRTAQIWDLEIQRRREYLQGHTDHVSAVYYHPDHQKLITGSLDGTIRIWDSTTYRLEKIIALNLGAVSDVRYIEELQRIIIGCYQGIAIMEINFDELSIASKG